MALSSGSHLLSCPSLPCSALSCPVPSPSSSLSVSLRPRKSRSAVVALPSCDTRDWPCRCAVNPNLSFLAVPSSSFRSCGRVHATTMFGRSNRPSLGQYDFAVRDPVSNEPPTRSRANSRFREIQPSLRSLQQRQGDSSSSEDDIIAKPKPLSKHSRSMSHPFPSLFSSKKKKHAAADNEFGYDDDVGDHDYNTKIYSSSSQAANPSKAAPGPAELATGNCMTCAGLVRWPKELSVFRCTKCLTINDVKSYTLAPRSTIRIVSHPASRAQPTGASPLGGPVNTRS